MPAQLSFAFDEMVSCPRFSLGDEVTFEISPHAGSALPRHDYKNKDNGATGVHAKGKVKEVSDQWIVIRYTCDGYLGEGECKFPNTLNTNYSWHQWSTKGYVAKISEKETSCDCGGTKCNTTHSFWCSIYNKEKYVPAL